ncbi:MAG TPA: head GIN domain-containing protein [Mucilaginibacter sp.]|jgi:hypothetical protein|nr:head GIN domain-containing protein [Mucilaginibacter sp.]
MKSIFKFILPAAMMVAFAGFTSAATHSANARSTSEIVDRHLSGFHAIDVAGSYDVYITQGTTESVKVEAPSDMMSHIKTDVDNGVLRIYNKNDHFHWGDLWGHHQKIRVYVVAKDLNAISVSGSGDASFRDGIRANSLKLNVSGSGDMTGRVEAKTLESDISGSGDMKLSGHADNSTVSVVGSGDFTARSLTTMSTTVQVSGSGDAQIYASDKLDASVVGSGDVSYSGHPKSVHKSKSGSGDINGN